MFLFRLQLDIQFMIKVTAKENELSLHDRRLDSYRGNFRNLPKTQWKARNQMRRFSISENFLIRNRLYPFCRRQPLSILATSVICLFRPNSYQLFLCPRPVQCSYNRILSQTPSNPICFVTIPTDVLSSIPVKYISLSIPFKSWECSLGRALTTVRQ